MSNKLVLFDWGGVVTNHENDLSDYKDARYRTIKHFNEDITYDIVNSNWISVNEKNINIDSFTNERDLMDWFELLKKRIGFECTYDEFKKAYKSEFSKINYYVDVVSFANNLWKKCKTGILSNLSMLEGDRIASQFDFSKFDYIFLSYEIGLVKPDPMIFKYVLDKTNMDAKDILFIDDNGDNIKVAKDLGFNTCLATGKDLDYIKKCVYDFL